MRMYEHSISALLDEGLHQLQMQYLVLGVHIIGLFRPFTYT